MRVLSLFDGMSCGLQALKEAGIPVEVYYASEIDKYATQISEKNHPEIIRLWDVNNWRDWDIWEIDIIIWWSPCQDLSSAGKGAWLSWARSWLFWIMLDIIHHYKPKYFLLENVASMSKENKKIITDAIWVEPILINSWLLTAQNRKRLYRTNIPWIIQPEDKWILLKDILEENVDKSFYMNAKQIMWIRKSKYRDRNPYYVDWKIWTLKIGGDVKRIFATQLGSSPKFWNCCGSDKWYTLRASNPNWVFIGGEIRYITPIEAERLQWLPDNYTEWVSKTQRYKMIGNWWTIPIISRIFSFIK